MQGEVFHTDLMELPFGEFNIILEMEWLSEHRLILNYNTKRDTLRTSSKNVIIMVGEHQNYLTNVIFTLIMDKLFHKGCDAYLVYILDTNVVSVAL